MLYFSPLGTSEVVTIPEHLQAAFKDDKMIQMSEPNPDPELYISNHDGTWILGVDYATARKISILREWPVDKQMEAFTEMLEDTPRPDKYNKLKEFISIVKEKYPKPKSNEK